MFTDAVERSLSKNNPSLTLGLLATERQFLRALIQKNCMTFFFIDLNKLNIVTGSKLVNSMNSTLNGQNKTADELLVFSRYLRKQTAEIESVRQLLLSQMREEFIELTSFEPVTMFSLFKSIKKNVMQFFCISALKN